MPPQLQQTNFFMKLAQHVRVWLSLEPCFLLIDRHYKPKLQRPSDSKDLSLIQVIGSETQFILAPLILLYMNLIDEDVLATQIFPHKGPTHFI